MDIASFVIYFSVFIFSICFTGFSEFLSRKKGRKTINFYIFSAAAILAPCILASVRDITVGSDVIGYLIPNYYLAMENTSFFVYSANQIFKIERFFSALIWIFSKIGSLSLLLFTIEFLIIAPIYYSLYLRRDKISMVMGMTIFLFLFYNFSLSCMRQSISMSFLVLSTEFLIEKKNKRAILLAIIATQFHKSVYLVILLFLIIYYIYNIPYKKRKIYYYFFAFILLASFIYYTNIAMAIANLIQPFSGRYSYYIVRYLKLYNGKKIWGNIPATDMICKSALIFITYVFYKLTKKYDSDKNYMIWTMILGRYFTLFNANFYESLRIAYYFDYFLILFVPNVCVCFKKDKINNLLTIFVFGLPCFLYWFYFIMFIGAYNTNHFIFR